MWSNARGSVRRRREHDERESRARVRAHTPVSAFTRKEAREQSGGGVDADGRGDEHGGHHERDVARQLPAHESEWEEPEEEPEENEVTPVAEPPTEELWESKDEGDDDRRRELHADESEVEVPRRALKPERHLVSIKVSEELVAVVADSLL